MANNFPNKNKTKKIPRHKQKKQTDEKTSACFGFLFVVFIA
jgi:hypothetical protein